jgi:hypothetical protein
MEGSKVFTLISFSAGVLIEAVIMSRTEDRMRVVAPAFGDAIELRRYGQSWFTDLGERVEFELLLSDEPVCASAPHWAAARECTVLSAGM